MPYARRSPSRCGARAPLALLAALSCSALETAGAQAAAPAGVQTEPVAGGGVDSVSPAAAARARAERRGASVAVIDVREVDLATVHTLSELLASRVPGVTVRRTSGGAGAGAGVWMRGPAGVEGTDAAMTSDPFGGVFPVIGARDPILVVDGIRADGTQQSLAITGDAVAPSRLDDFRLEDLATVEVLRGPAAAALYGAGAERGVIVLTTRRGERGAPRGGLYARTAASTSAASYAPLYGRIDTRTGELGCTLERAAAGTCTPGAVLRRDALGGSSVYDTGMETDVGGFVQGAAGSRLRLYAGGGVDDRPGLYDQNDARRAGGRARVDASLASTLDLVVTGGYLHGDAQLPFAGGNVGDPLAGALRLRADGTPRPSFPATFTIAPPDYAVRQELARATAGAALAWRPTRWLTSRVTYGTDDARRDERRADVWYVEAPDQVTRMGGKGRVRSTTLGVGAEARYAVGPSLAAATTIGFERVARTTRDSTGEELYGGPGSGLLLSSRSWWSSHTLRGLYLAQRLAWRDRLHLDLGLRDDRETQADYHVGLQRSAELSWAIGGPESGGGWRQLWADRARLRTAYGRVGLPAPVGVGTTWWAGLGDVVGAGPAPERPEGEGTRELELGGDASYLGGRLDFALTGYDKLTSRGIVGTLAAGNTGPDALDVRNRGVELQVGARLLRTERLRWDAGLTFAANRNRVEKLRAAPIVLSDGPGVEFTNFIWEGKPLAVYLSRPILGYADRDGDGAITSAGCYDADFHYSAATCEVTIGDFFRETGTPYPTREGSLSSSLVLGRRVTLSGLLDYRGGVRLYNATHYSRCLGINGNCRELSDPSAPGGDQARVVASEFDGASMFVEDAGYVKLREVALAVRVPERWVRPAGSLTITAAVRNLATWTRYSGGDPEVAMSALALSGTDYYSQAQPRTLVLRAEVQR
ncbi:MAG: TonB-dependent receptor plug domain-containing protein [Gemmatimonadaceae bacterium]